jgi:putative transposase
LHAIVHSAGIQDRDGGILLLATLFGMFPFLEKLFADSA